MKMLVMILIAGALVSPAIAAAQDTLTAQPAASSFLMALPVL
jgi:hypothetical protein